MAGEQKVIRIPMSQFQQERFALLRKESQLLIARQNDWATLVIANQIDPNTVLGWEIEITDDGFITCTEPRESIPPAPQRPTLMGSDTGEGDEG